MDDNEANLDLMKESFQDDYDVVTVNSGDKAIDFLKNSTPAVVLLDLMMPGVDGYEVCKHIRLVKRFWQTKIILVSASIDLQDKLDGYKFGANDFMSKPFVVEELKAKVKVYMDLYKAEKELSKINHDLKKDIKERTQHLLQIELDKIKSLRPAEIVHNMKSPLTVILGLTDLLFDQYPEITQLKIISKASKRLSGMIHSILEIEEGHVYVDESISLDEVIQDELEVVSFLNQSKNVINIFFDAADNFPHIKGKKHHFSQMIGNLIKNSAEAMMVSDKKELKVTTRIESEYLTIEVSDTGCGVAAEDFERIFHSHYTTKEKQYKENSGGSGLGLGYCKKMVEFYGGTVKIHSKLGQGTTLTLFFPIHLAIRSE
ncbi:MAG: ATP-binding protein [Oligoflexales bacterium]